MSVTLSLTMFGRFAADGKFSLTLDPHDKLGTFQSAS
jgi:hypothetical protein